MLPLRGVKFSLSLITRMIIIIIIIITTTTIISLRSDRLGYSSGDVKKGRTEVFKDCRVVYEG